MELWASPQTINHPVDGGIAQDDLYIFAGLGKRDGFDQFRYLFIIPFGFPERDAVFAGVVGGGRVLGSASQATRLAMYNMPSCRL